MTTERLAMVIDSASCIDCKGCMAACKVENQVPDGHWRNWIRTEEVDFRTQRSETRIDAPFQPGNCMHCDNPTCVKACPTEATFKDKTNGTVRVNKRLCIGCGSCIPACPYGARYRHPGKRVVDKCDFCEERRKRGDLPACVVTCPTKARVFGDINDPKSEASDLLKKGPTLRVVHSEIDTLPNIYYLGGPQPVNWPQKPRIPSPIKIWERFANPLVWFVVGVNALGVLAMLGKQVLLPEREGGADDHHPEKPDGQGIGAAEKGGRHGK